MKEGQEEKDNWCISVIGNARFLLPVFFLCFLQRLLNGNM